MTDTARPWVDGLTFAEVLRRTAERHGQRDALVFPRLGHRRSYAGASRPERAAAAPGASTAERAPARPVPARSDGACG